MRSPQTWRICRLSNDASIQSGSLETEFSRKLLHKLWHGLNERLSVGKFCPERVLPLQMAILLDERQKREIVIGRRINVALP
jgi:hypothetical protein